MPVVFVSHGSPMLPFEDIPARKFMLGLGAKLPRPKAILCISAHWESPIVRATGAEKLETIHDFFGFPRRSTSWSSTPPARRSSRRAPSRS
jgi:4,5-DOPA dioxygenase extradiol